MEQIKFFFMTICLLFLWSTTKTIAGQVLITGQSNLSYHVISKIFMDGKLVSSPEIIVSPGQTASLVMIDQSKPHFLKIKMAINEKKIPKKNDPLKVNFDIQYTDNKKKISTSPVLLLVPGQESNVNFVSNGSRLEIFALAKTEGTLQQDQNQVSK